MTRKYAVYVMKTCAFTGHRPKGLGYPESDGRCVALKKKLRSLIIRMIEEEKVTHFISGMAQGVDMYAAEIVLDLKQTYPYITLECAIPYEEQAAHWSAALRDGTDGVVCQRDRETGLDSPAGYLGIAIKKASLRWQRGFFFFDTS